MRCWGRIKGSAVDLTGASSLSLQRATAGCCTLIHRPNNLSTSTMSLLTLFSCPVIAEKAKISFTSVTVYTSIIWRWGFVCELCEPNTGKLLLQYLHLARFALAVPGKAAGQCGTRPAANTQHYKNQSCLLNMGKWSTRIWRRLDQIKNSK